MDTELLKVDSIQVFKKYQRSKTKQDGELTRSIRDIGLQDPIFVLKIPRKNKDLYYLVDGLRRMQAIKSLGQEDIECIIETYQKSHKFPTPQMYMDFLRIVIDSKRQDLLPSQRARYIELLMDKFSMPAQEVAIAFGIAVPTLINSLKVRKCSKEIRVWIDDGKLPISTGVLLSKLTDSAQAQFLNKYKDRPRVKIKEVERYVRNAPATMHRRSPIRNRIVARGYSGKGSLASRVTTLTKRRDYLREEHNRLQNQVSASKALSNKLLRVTELRKQLPSGMAATLESFMKEV